MCNLNDRIISLYENDYSVEKIASLFNVSVDYVNDTLDDDAYFNYADEMEDYYVNDTLDDDAYFNYADEMEDYYD